jgi:hypothetical protein
MATGIIRGATVAWLPPLDDGGAPITSFAAEVVPGGARCVTTTTTCSIKGLADGATYQIATTDETEWGTSAPVTVKVVAGVVPGPPARLRLAIVGKSLVIRWSPSSAPTDEAVQRYSVAVTWIGTQLASCSTSATSCNVPMHLLSGAGTVAVTVRAQNASGWSRPRSGSILP